MGCTGASGRVVVVGSVNADYVFRLEQLPAPGETVLALGSDRTGGGKGGNQACAAARWGASTSLVALLGSDGDGDAALADLRRWGVRVDEVGRTGAAPTGQAIILVDRTGENSIVVSAGANAALDPDTVQASLDRLGLTSHDVVLTSGEVSSSVVSAAAQHCRATATLHLHNLAPARAEDLDAARYALVVLNEVELAQATPVDTELTSGLRALARTRPGSVLTRGAEGAVVAADGELTVVPAPKTEVVDSTGAGDAFCGVLAAELAAGRPLLDSARAAVRAGSYAVTGAGARGALLRREESAGLDR